MHLNHFFLKALAAELEPLLMGARLEEAFSQERDELVLLFRLRDGGAEWHLRAFLRAELAYLSFPAQFNRARANTASLFTQAYGLAVRGVAAVPYDRSLYITLQNGYVLLFKLHGNRSNVALLQGETVEALFKIGQTADQKLALAGLQGNPTLTEAAFDAAGQNLYKLLPQIGTETRAWLQETGQCRTWADAQAVLQRLAQPAAYYLTHWQGKTQLLLFAAGQVEQTYTSALEAAQGFARAISYRFYLEQEKRQAAQTLARRREQTVLYLEKLRLRRQALQEGRLPNQLADLIMAHMHRFAGVRPGQPVELEDFYTGGLAVVTLKEAQTPQALAQQLYRKAKNMGQELARLQEQEEARLLWLLRLEEAEAHLPAWDDIRDIRRRLAELGPALTAKADEETLPYRAVDIRGWEVRIGKNAVANDALLRAHSHKDDLWLHAKDVPGSHVLVCRKPGQAYPKDVVEAAAALAAWHSKKRTETLADVMVTERKYVRKVKGSPAGAVRVERERVLLVRPEDRV